MATGIAIADGFFQGGVYAGCISSDDTEVCRRPYHRDCNCPLHKLSEHRSHVSLRKPTTVSYPLSRVYNGGVKK